MSTMLICPLLVNLTIVSISLDLSAQLAELCSRYNQGVSTSSSGATHLPLVVFNAAKLLLRRLSP
jgi:hypothetical protein